MDGREQGLVERARAGDRTAFDAAVTPHLPTVRAHCYRMLGSVHDADDAVQESLVRAWRGLGGFEQRASFRTWLYRIATHACLDVISKSKPKTLPWARTEPNGPEGPPLEEPIWLEPFPDALSVETTAPDAALDARESVALAFLVALQEMPPKQRAVLLLRDVLGFSAEESADVLELSVAAANSALQRARDAITARREEEGPRVPDDAEKKILARYVRAWEQADVTLLVSLLRDDAKLSMPPLPFWLLGASAIGKSVGGMVLRPETRGAFRGVLTHANGQPAVAMYRRKSDGFVPMALHVVRLDGNAIAEITAFLDPRTIAAFGTSLGA